MQPGTLAAVQFEPTPGAIEVNLEAFDEYLAGLPAAVDLAVFPEMSVTGYDLDVATAEAEPIPGDLTDRLVDLAADHDTHVAAGVPERVEGAVYNDLVYVSGSGIEGRYRKQKLWGDEAEVFEASHDPVVVETELGRVGLLVCYDLNFPELALEYADQAVDLLIVASAWRTEFLDDWDLLLRARALDTTAYVVGSNHTGAQNGREHAGNSMIVGPSGNILARAGKGPATIAAEVTPGAIEEARERNPVLADRDP